MVSVLSVVSSHGIVISLFLSVTMVSVGRTNIYSDKYQRHEKITGITSG